MDISFASTKLKRQLSDERAMRRAFGDRSRRLQMRLDLLKAVNSLADVPSEPPPRCHQLTGDRRGCFAVDITANWRLVFRPSIGPVPLKRDGGIDLSAVTAVELVAIEDYH